MMKKVLLFVGALFLSSALTAQFDLSVTDWSVVKAGHVKNGLEDMDGDFDDNGSNNWTTMDMNGDSMLDLVITSENNTVFGFGVKPYWKVHLNTGTRFSPAALIWEVPDVGLENVGINKHSGVATKSGEETWSTVDINGDGRPDLVLTSFFNPTGNKNTPFDQGSNSKWKVYLNTGTQFSSTSIDWAVPTSGDVKTGISYLEGQHTFSGGNKWTTMDVDGDKKPDLVFMARASSLKYIVNGQGIAPYWEVYINKGTGFDDTAIQWSVPEGGHASYGFNGKEGSYDLTGGNGWFTSDMNGDSKPDLVVSSYYKKNFGLIVFGVTGSPYWKVYMNTGSGFSSQETNWDVPKGGEDNRGFHTFKGHGVAASDNSWNFMDLDGDNKPELIVTTKYKTASIEEVFGHGATPYWNVYKNMGNRFSDYPLKWNVPDVGTSNGLIDLSGKGVSTGSHGWNVVDMNGDAKPELVLTSLKGSVGGHAVYGVTSQPYWRLYYNNGKVLSIQSDLGADKSALNLYPNPTNALCHLEWENNIKDGNIVVMDVHGVVLFKQSGVGGTSFTLDLNYLSYGVYFVQLIDGNSIIQSKLIKE